MATPADGCWYCRRGRSGLAGCFTNLGEALQTATGQASDQRAATLFCSRSGDLLLHTQGRTLRFKVTGLAAPTVAGGSAPEQPLLQFPFHGVRELTATSCYPDGDLTVDFSLASGHEGFQRAPYQTGAGLSLFCAIFAAMPKRCRWANGYGW
jgi:hypothetical protein